jgi:hypothetical protein
VARRIDRAFFREAYDARLLLEELTERAREVESRDELASLLDQSLRRALRPTRSEVFLAVPSGRLAHFGAEPLSSLDPDTLFFGAPDREKGQLRPLVGPEAAVGALASLSPECLVPLPGRKGGNLQASLRSRPPAAFRDLRSLLGALNGQLCESTEPSRYATLFLSTWEDSTRQLRYVCCGHGPPLLLRAGGGVERVEPTASVLGLFEDWEGEVAETRLDPGDWLVLYTDGVTEAHDPSGEEFGEQRLIEAMRAGRDSDPESALVRVFASVDAWCAGTEQWDDQTLLLARAE